MPRRAISHLDAKVPFPSAMRTGDWELVPLEIRERAFFMAGVENAQILALFQREAEAIATGASTNDESMRRIRSGLDAMGYQPDPGDEGSMQDLGSLRRMRVVLDTNVEQARGHAMWVRSQGSLRAFPAWRYIRAAHREVPRDWPEKWQAARTNTVESGSTEGGPMVALINHPLWRDAEFNRFQSPYPPFDFNSGMAVQPVKRSEARELGLLTGSERDQDDVDAMMQPVPTVSRSLNEAMEARPELDTPGQRDALAHSLRGLAQWEDDTLIHLDPNGTRPGTPEEIAQIVTADMAADPITGDPWPTLQADAVTQATRWQPLVSGQESMGEDVARDLARLIGRAMPEDDRTALWSLIGYLGLAGWLADWLVPTWADVPASQRVALAGERNRRAQVLGWLEVMIPRLL